MLNFGMIGDPVFFLCLAPALALAIHVQNEKRKKCVLQGPL
jgi:hypothetical protein